MPACLHVSLPAFWSTSLSASWTDLEEEKRRGQKKFRTELTPPADIVLRTTNRAKDYGNMHILIFHMYHIASCQESFKIYSSVNDGSDRSPENWLRQSDRGRTVPTDRH